METKIHFNQKGSVLLVTLLIMVGIIATTIGLAFVIMTEIQQARNIDYSIVAYYAAETAVEDALYQIRKTDVELDDLDTSGLEVELDNKAKWSRETQGTENQIYGSLKQNETLSIDLFDPDDLISNPGIESIMIDIDDETGSDFTWVEMTITEWEANPGVIWTGKYQRIFQSLYPNSTDPIINNKPNDTYAYQVRIKALYDNLPKFTVTAWDNNDPEEGVDNIVPIPGRAVITGIGDFVHSKQAVKVSLPRRAPLSGVFDYILFSEEAIQKQ